MFHFKNYVTKIMSLHETAFTYKHNHVFHNPLTQFKSQGLIFFVLQVHLRFPNFSILIFKIPMY